MGRSEPDSSNKNHASPANVSKTHKQIKKNESEYKYNKTSVISAHYL